MDENLITREQALIDNSLFPITVKKIGHTGRAMFSSQFYGITDNDNKLQSDWFGNDRGESLAWE